MEPTPSAPRAGLVLALHTGLALFGMWCGGALGVLLTAIALWCSAAISATAVRALETAAGCRLDQRGRLGVAAPAWRRPERSH